MTPESKFKRELIRKLKEQYPGAVILKNDANDKIGIPDHLMLYGRHWIAFEAKASQHAAHRPNQDYWVNLLNSMSFASFVYPQNEGWFLHEVQRSL